MAGAGSLQPHLRVVVKFDLASADPPYHPPVVRVRETAQRVVTDGVEKFQLGGMRDKVLRSARKLLRDDTGHRLERSGGMIVDHDLSPLIGRLAGDRRGGGRLSGVGGGFGGRFNFWPSALCAFFDGLGPRASGFFMKNNLPHFPTAGARPAAVSG